MKKIYKYEIKKVNMVNGREKDDVSQVYESEVRLKVGQVYFNLLGCGAGYRVLKELSNESNKKSAV